MYALPWRAYPHVTRGANDSLHVTVIDITGRKRAEEKLARATDTLQQTLNIITDCHYMLDRQWRFTRINDRALHILEWGRKYLAGATGRFSRAWWARLSRNTTRRPFPGGFPLASKYYLR